MTFIDFDDKIWVSRYDPATGGATLTAITRGEFNAHLGWGDYIDTQYTEGSPFVPTVGIWQPLPNNALAGPRDHEPVGLPLYGDGKIRGFEGDALTITVEMAAKPTTGTETYLDMAIDIGGTIGRIFPSTKSFPRGLGFERYFHFTVGCYTLDTWEANGGTVVIRPNADIEIYNIRYVITRSYDGTEI